MAAPSFDDLFNLGKAEAILKRPKLGVRIGDISEMLISGAAAMADRVIGWFADRIAATFLDGAVGADLTKLAADHWNIQRNAATSSIATVTFNRASADATSQTIPIGFVVSTAKDSQGNATQFVTTSAVSWAISTNGTQVANVAAVVPGLDGNLPAANMITNLVTSAPAGGTYTITASSLPAGGADDESDGDLRDRVRLYPSTLRRGTIAALEYGAQQTTGIAVAKANAIQDSTGAVIVYVSDASGNSTGSPIAVASTVVDDGSMTAKVAITLYDWAAAGALVTVQGGAIQTVNVTVSCAVKIGVDINQLIANIQASITTRINKLNIGDTLYIADIINAVKAVDPDNIVNVAMVTPLTDLVPTLPGNLIRPGVITVTG
ncbi:MAG TPA: baseplate J/gp47 family protein [Candidatus Paceibacterota bacterium]